MCILASALPIMALLRPVPHDLVWLQASKLALPTNASSKRERRKMCGSERESIEKCDVFD